MTEYNLKRTPEHGSLEEVVGELNESKTSSKNRKEIIIKNVKAAAIIGAGSFIGELGTEYLRLGNPIIDVENLLFRTLIIGGGLAGLDAIIRYAYKKNWPEAFELSAGIFVGFAVGYNLGHIVSTYLK